MRPAGHTGAYTVNGRHLCQCADMRSVYSLLFKVPKYISFAYISHSYVVYTSRILNSSNLVQHSAAIFPPAAFFLH